ncbi:hypothetical protein [Thermomonospora catenispora]|uniref:hypothetical protein n=1 Tax=Thermomonospora catenispora TaxID=2493090 RepID=UPI001123CADA|nr:hypothetical protein [Thermomonospora catenispora]TNY35872.1 hypothetical protein EIO00_16465 [Thermomonospora catenispora]
MPDTARGHAVSALLTVAAVAAACSVRDAGAAEAATALFAAVQRGDGRAACAALSPKAVSSVETGGSRCPERILTLGLRGGPIHDVRVWGDRARLRAGEDTVFLVRLSGLGWKVAAAGCRPRPGRPYDCDVEA